MRTYVVLVACLGFFCLGMTIDGFALWGNAESNHITLTTTPQLIVKFKPGVDFTGVPDKSGIVRTSRADINALHSKYVVSAQDALVPSKAPARSHFASVVVITPEAGADLEAMAREYERLDAVEYACPNYPLELYAAPDDSLYAHQWALNNTGQAYYHVERIAGDNNDTLALVSGVVDADIDGLEAYENPPDNADAVVVAILDTGVDYNHPDLADNIWSNPGETHNGIDDDHNGYIDDLRGWDFSGGNGAGDNNPMDTHGHGTHCSGIVAGIINNDRGIAGTVPDVKIMAVSMAMDFTVAGGTQAIIYAADNGADVISMSWGMAWPIPLLKDALNYAREQGTVLIASAGNDGVQRVNYPAGFDATIAISASNSDDLVTEWSTYGPNVELCAPGLSILSLRAAGTDMYSDHGEPLVHIIDNDYYLASGTSMSGPYAAAVAAYVRSVSPGLSPDMVREVLHTSADDFLDPIGMGWNVPGWDQYSGYGRVNLPAAIAAAPKRRAIISEPATFTVAAGNIDIYGSADGDDFSEYTLDYMADDGSDTWHTFTTSASSVSDGLLGSWDASGLTGEYIIRLNVNETNFDRARIYIGNEPMADLQLPADGQIISGMTTVSGSAMCTDFDYFELYYGVGASPTTWNLITRVTRPIFDDLLYEWNAIDLDEGTYSLRLAVYSTSGLEATDMVTVEIQSPFTPPLGWTYLVGDKLAHTINYADIDKDMEYEFVVGTESGIVFLNTDFTPQTTNIPDFPDYDFRIVPAVGRLDTDAFDDIVAVASNGRLYIYRSQFGLTYIQLPVTPNDIDNFLTGSEVSLPKVFLKDIDNDGIDEIHYTPGAFFQGLAGYHFIYHADGTPVGCWSAPPSTYTHCLPADLDGDGYDEIYCMGPELTQYDTCGNVVNSVPLDLEGWELHYRYIGLSAVDIDDDGIVELIVSGRYNPGSPYGDNFWIYVFDEGLVLRSGWPHDTGINGNVLVPAPPLFGDLDNDGSLEYVMSHSDLDNGYLRVWHIDGSSFTGDSTSQGMFVSSASSGCFTTPIIADADGNGTADIVVASNSGEALLIPFIERVCGYAPDAQVLDKFPMIVNEIPMGFKIHMPLVGDIDQDGELDMVYTSSVYKVQYARFTGVPYNAGKAFYPMWRYNRRLNATQNKSSGYVCGDANGDGVVNIGDAVYIINYIFKNGAAPYPLEAGDSNCDGVINVGDAVYIVNYIFKNGSEPCCP